jgi:hypothetical protein
MMRVLTVRQPWAHAIIFGGKDVENRARNIAGSYRGPVAIHAGRTTATLASDQRRLLEQLGSLEEFFEGEDIIGGAILGVVDLIDVHTADDYEQTKNLRGLWPTCSQWAERVGFHLVLANPRPLTTPIPFKGALGLRTLDELTATAVMTGLQT